MKIDWTDAVPITFIILGVFFVIVMIVACCNSGNTSFPTLESERFVIIAQDGGCLILEDKDTGQQYVWLPSNAKYDKYERGTVIEINPA